MSTITYKTNHGNANEILDHLKACDEEFLPPLSQRVDLVNYSEKLANSAANFEAWNDSQSLIGLVSVYMNDPFKKTAFITSVSIISDYTGKGIAKKLMEKCLNQAKQNGFRQLRLEVNRKNVPAVNLYKAFGFEEFETINETLKMNLVFKKDDTP